MKIVQQIILDQMCMIDSLMARLVKLIIELLNPNHNISKN